jgi:hypothetical protein
MKFHPVNNLKYVDFNNRAYFQESLKYAGPLEERGGGVWLQWVIFLQAHASSWLLCCLDKFFYSYIRIKRGWGAKLTYVIVFILHFSLIFEWVNNQNCVLYKWTYFSYVEYSMIFMLSEYTSLCTFSISSGQALPYPILSLIPPCFEHSIVVSCYHNLTTKI